MATGHDIRLKDKPHACSDIMASLETFECLKGMDTGKLAGFLTLRKLAAGEVFFKEGDKADSMAFIVYGRLEIKKQTEFPDKYFVLSLLGNGSFIGEKAALGKASGLHRATATALEETCVAVLKNDFFEEILERSPDIASGLLRALLAEVSARLNGANERMAAVF